jgi:hypothetical protein
MVVTDEIPDKELRFSRLAKSLGYIKLEVKHKLRAICLVGCDMMSYHIVCSYSADPYGIAKTI